MKHCQPNISKEKGKLNTHIHKHTKSGQIKRQTPKETETNALAFNLLMAT